MADRVFPNNNGVDMGSKLTFNGIDWDAVSHNMQNQRFAEDQSQEIQELLKEIENKTKEVNELKEDMPEDMDVEEEVSEEATEEEAEDAGNEEAEAYRKSSASAMRKVAFTHPSQISAEALEIAEKAGDTELVKTILAARKANRTRIASAIQDNLNKELRKAQRHAILKMAENMEVEESVANDVTTYDKYDAETLKEMAKAFGDDAPEGLENAIKQKETMEVTAQFTSPTKFTLAQREAFNKVALSLGMPKEYVEAMCEPSLPSDVKELNSQIESVYDSNLPVSAKTAAVKALVKEAKLSPESKQEFIRYWNDILGYQDKDFWPMVAADYTEDKKVN